MRGWGILCSPRRVWGDGGELLVLRVWMMSAGEKGKKGKSVRGCDREDGCMWVCVIYHGGERGEIVRVGMRVQGGRERDA